MGANRAHTHTPVLLLQKKLKVKESLAGLWCTLTCCHGSISSELGLFQPAVGLPGIVNSAVSAQECAAQVFQWGRGNVLLAALLFLASCALPSKGGLRGHPARRDAQP